ncbi:hypothetical protein HY990_05425 [Candidatus Micrarchaeota archaeon]|nr:hypothetical protein [Candidatus Micrarchaeota archaeon]
MVVDRVYQCEISKKSELMKILEADPYKADSFARIGYRTREGAMIDEDKNMFYVYVAASDEFVKSADERLKSVAPASSVEVQKRVVDKIKEQEEAAEEGLGSIFG